MALSHFKGKDTWSNIITINKFNIPQDSFSGGLMCNTIGLSLNMLSFPSKIFLRQMKKINENTTRLVCHCGKPWKKPPEQPLKNHPQKERNYDQGLYRKLHQQDRRPLAATMEESIHATTKGTFCGTYLLGRLNNGRNRLFYCSWIFYYFDWNSRHNRFCYNDCIETFHSGCTLCTT